VSTLPLVLVDLVELSQLRLFKFDYLRPILDQLGLLHLDLLYVLRLLPMEGFQLLLMLLSDAVHGLTVFLLF